MTGSLTLKRGNIYYTLYFAHHGWMAADMIQYLGDVYAAPDPEVAILKLLGYTLEVASQNPPRTCHHWVEVDLDRRLLVTNSELVRKAVHQKQPEPDDPYLAMSLRNVYQFLDLYDFKVQLHHTSS